MKTNQFMDIESIKNEILLIENKKLNFIQKVFNKLKIFELEELIDNNKPIKRIELPFKTKKNIFLYFSRLILFIVSFSVIIWEIESFVEKDYFVCFLLSVLILPILLGWYYLLFYRIKKHHLIIDDKSIKNNNNEYFFENIETIFILIKYGGRGTLEDLIILNKDKTWTKIEVEMYISNYKKLCVVLCQILKSKTT